MSMRLDHLRARLMEDLQEMADYLEDHPHDEYAALGADLRAMRTRLHEHGHVKVAEPLPLGEES